MLANGGKLVKPYVVSQVETSAARGQAPVVAMYASEPAARNAGAGRSCKPRRRSVP